MVFPKVIYELKEVREGHWRLFSHRINPDVEAYLTEADDAKAAAWIKELEKLREYRLFWSVPRLRYRYQKKFKEAFPAVEVDQTDTADNYRDDVRLIAEKLNRVPTVADVVKHSDWGMDAMGTKRRCESLGLVLAKGTPGRKRKKE